ncbi:MAG: hypothetical protein IJZ59_06745 [Alphaproteobacteria bacterium]|nr:hypothetical protein [Alphaproteobacteria bacterium]
MNNIELAINITVIILLIATIICIWRFSRNLSVLRNKHDSLQNLVLALNTAADKANNAINGLKTAANEASLNVDKAIEKTQIAEEKLLKTTRNISKDVDFSYAPSTPQNRLAKNIQQQFEPNIGEDEDEEKSESEIELLKVLRSIR